MSVATVAEWNAAPCTHPRVVVDERAAGINASGRIVYLAKCLECLMETYMSKNSPHGVTYEQNVDGILELIQ